MLINLSPHLILNRIPGTSRQDFRRRIRITLMRIRKRIQLFTLLRIRNLFLIKVMEICDHWPPFWPSSLDHPRLHFKPPKLLSVDFNADQIRIQHFDLMRIWIRIQFQKPHTDPDPNQGSHNWRNHKERWWKAYEDPRSSDLTQFNILLNVFILVPITLTSAKWALPCVSMQACAGWARISQILIVRSHEHEAITFFSLGDHLENKGILKVISKDWIASKAAFRVTSYKIIFEHALASDNGVSNIKNLISSAR